MRGMLRLSMSILLLLLLSGCTRVLDVSGTDWRRQGASFQQVTLDEVECARSSDHAGDLPHAIVGGIIDKIVVPLEDVRRGAAYDRCMEKKGYGRVAAQR